MRVKFSRMNFETECMYDLINGRGFFITEMPFSDVDKSIRNVHGPRSSLYGAQYTDANDASDRWHCSCGRTIGAAFEGEKCPFCNTVIEHKDVDILYTGWISLGKFKIISPR